jgi:hypothetical protein
VKPDHDVDSMLKEARDDVAHADQKAGLLLAALGVGFGAILGGQLAGDLDPATFSLAGQILWWAGVVLAVGSVISAALAVWPRYILDDSPRFGITYWGHIAVFDELADLDRALDADATTSGSRIRHQLWRISRLLLWKYRFVRSALVCGGVAAALIAVAASFIR